MAVKLNKFLVMEPSTREISPEFSSIYDETQVSSGKNGSHHEMSVSIEEAIFDSAICVEILVESSN
jgi:hypothetical protein